MQKETRKSISSEDLATFHTTPPTHQPTPNQHGSENILNTGFHFGINIPDASMRKATRKSISSEGLATFHTTPHTHQPTQNQHGSENILNTGFHFGIHIRDASMQKAIRKSISSEGLETF